MKSLQKNALLIRLFMLAFLLVYFCFTKVFSQSYPYFRQDYFSPAYIDDNFESREVIPYYGNLTDDEEHAQLAVAQGFVLIGNQNRFYQATTAQKTVGYYTLTNMKGEVVRSQLFPNFVPTRVIELLDGELLFQGFTFVEGEKWLMLLCLRQDGSIKWERRFKRVQGTTMGWDINLVNQHYIMMMEANPSNYFSLWKIDINNGMSIGSITYVLERSVQFFDMKNKDGKTVLVGEIIKPSGGGFNGLIAVLDNNDMQINWIREVSYQANNLLYEDAIITSEGIYAIGTTVPEERAMLLSAFDINNGNLLFSKGFQNETANITGRSITSIGNRIYLLTERINGYQTGVVQTDFAGNKMASYSYGKNSEQYFSININRVQARHEGEIYEGLVVATYRDMPEFSTPTVLFRPHLLYMSKNLITCEMKPTEVTEREVEVTLNELYAERILVAAQSYETQTPQRQGMLDSLYCDYTFDYLNYKKENESHYEAKKEENGLLIYPNPSQGAVTISFDLVPNLTTQVELRDNLGRLVYTQTLAQNQHTVQLNQLKRGFYIITIKNSSQTLTKKLIVE